MTNSKTCIRCGHPHEEKTGTCEACKVITGGNHHYRNSPVQSVSEGDQWQDHVDEYKRDREWCSDGRCSET